MQSYVFNQRARISQTLFVLRGRTLEVDGPAQRRVGAVSIDLGELSADFQRAYVRPGQAIALFVFLAVMCLLLARWLLVANGDMVAILAMYPGMFGLLFLGLAIRIVPKSECLVFRWNAPARQLVFVRENRQAAEMDAFLGELSRRIRIVHEGGDEAALEAGAPPVESQTVSAAKYSTGEESAGINPDSSSWVGALLAGAVALGTPLLALGQPGMQGAAFAVSFPATIGGIYTAIVSWRRRERFRFWAVLGGLMAVGPFFLFNGLR